MKYIRRLAPIVAFLEALAAAFILTFLAEFGDKTQLVVIALAARGRRLAVFLGAALAEVLLVGIAVVAADLVARLVPAWTVAVAAGGLFLVFGVLQLREAFHGEEEEDAVAERSGRNAFFSAFGLIAIGELGDKTQLTVAGLAAASGAPVATFIGGTAGLVAMTALGVVAGGLLIGRVSQRTIKIVAGVLFLAAGAVILVTGLL